MKFTETDIKYLSGLMDADGSLVFHFSPYGDRYNVSLKLVLQQSLSIDHEGRFIDWLNTFGGFKQFVKIRDEVHPNWSDANRWTVTSNEELNMLIPRLTKHMVIKAKHWQAMLERYNKIYGKSVNSIEMNELKEFAKTSRKNVGPLKDKKHPTWAWVAGYIDGDGCYYMRHRKKNWGIATELLVRVTCHNDDVQSLYLLQKAFGGSLKANNHENTHYWSRNLGNADKDFAIHFLRKMVRHSRLKKHKIEQLLHHHLQRLNEPTSTDDAIV
jgi:hypothetical protein